MMHAIVSADSIQGSSCGVLFVVVVQPVTSVFVARPVIELAHGATKAGAMNELISIQVIEIRPHDLEEPAKLRLRACWILTILDLRGLGLHQTANL
jgi:hypothetical protein